MDFDSDSTCQQTIEDVEKFQRHMLQRGTQITGVGFDALWKCNPILWHLNQ
jgi:hypothetical protein